MKNIGILLSGRGSNFEAIAKNVASGKIPNARIAIVVSNRADAGGIESARRLGLEAMVIPSTGARRRFSTTCWKTSCRSSTPVARTETQVPPSR